MARSGGNRGGGDGRGSGSRIHKGLVGARALIGTPYLADPSLRSEYAREIAPRTEVALGKILREVFPHPQGLHPRGANSNAGGTPRRVIDLGAGTGAAGAALRAYFGDDLELVSVDKVSTSEGIRTADVTDVRALARTVAGGALFDVVVAAHILNELDLDDVSPNRLARLATLVRRWCEVLLSDGGTLILIEPALRETSRALLGVRDQLLLAGLHVVAPCFFTGSCPALLRERDWCHDAVSAAAVPARLRPVNPDSAIFASARAVAEDDRRRARRDAPRVDFSYLVVRTSGEPTTDPTLFRIVSDPLPEKGRLKLFACGLSGRQPMVRLDRHRSSTNADLDQLVRGDSVRIARTTFAQDGLRVVADTNVTRETREG